MIGDYSADDAIRGVDRPAARIRRVLDVRDGEIHGVTFFLDTEKYFPLFGMPPRLEG